MTDLLTSTTRTPFLPVPERVAFTIPEWVPLIGGLDVMWYGVLLTTGIVLGFILLYKKAPTRLIDPEKTLDIALWCVPAGVIGARLYYVVFQLDYYLQHPAKILAIRDGGLAIHGGLLLGFGLGVILLRKWKQHPLDWTDLAVQGLALAQAIGRWGNYFNSEAHGKATDLPWAIYADGEFVHPTFLYESVWCFLMFLFFLWYDKHKVKYKGQITCLYAILYSVERFCVEAIRTDSFYIGPFKLAQVVSAGLIVLGVTGLILIHKFKDRLVIERPESKTEKV